MAVISPAAVGQFNELPSIGEGITAEPQSVLETNANSNAFNGQQGEQQGAEDVEGLEYLTRGPLHEAFADPYAANPAANPLVAASPPEPIRELPPDLKPSGDSITWIPGYWAWDDERSDFIWISGLWRDIPPGQRWLPGYWEPVGEGYRWISGLWLANEIEQVTYLPPPPESLEQGPSSPAPREDAFYIPGNWAYQTQEYQWTPGYWTQTQPEWIWVPASYAWTPRGCIYRPGYWDYAPEQRAVMFTPVYFQQTIYTSPRFVYRPRYVVNTGMNLLVHLFVRPNYRQYYFGDYYGAGFRQNYYPWVNYAQVGRGYDPLYTFYSRSSRYQQQNFFGQVNQHHQFFAQHSDLRPRHTLTAQRAFVNSDLSGFSGLTRANPNVLQLATIGQQLEAVARQNSSGRQFSRLNTTQLTQLGQQLENPVREMTNRRRDFEIERQLGNVSGAAAAGRGSRSDTPAGRRETSGRGGVDLAGGAAVDLSGGASADLTNRDRRGPPGDAQPGSGQSLRGNVDSRGSLQLPDVPALRDSARRGSPDLSTRGNSSGRGGNDSGDRSPYLAPRDSDPLSRSNRRAESPLNTNRGGNNPGLNRNPNPPGINLNPPGINLNPPGINPPSSNRGGAPSNTQRGGRLPNIERGATPPSINPGTIQPNRGGINPGTIQPNRGGINPGTIQPNRGGINRGGNLDGINMGGGNPTVTPRGGGNLGGVNRGGANVGGGGLGGGNSRVGGSIQGGRAPGANRGGLQGGNPGRSSPGLGNPGRSSPGRSSPGRSSPGRSSPGLGNPGRSSPGGGSPRGGNPGGGRRNSDDPGKKG